MKNIKIAQYGVALIAPELAKKISEEIFSDTKSEECTIDFSGVISLTTQFAKAMLSKTFKALGKTEFRNRVKFIFPDDDLKFAISDVIDSLYSDQAA